MNSNFLKIKYSLIIVVVISFMLAPFILRAQGTLPPPTGSNGGTLPPPSTGIITLRNPLKVDSIGELIQSFVEIFSYVAILFGVLMLIVTGFRFVMSQGSPEKRKELTASFFYIVIGIAVIIGARLIIDVVINTLSASGAVDPAVIQSARSASQGH